MSVIGLIVILIILAGAAWLVNVKGAAVVTGIYKLLINIVIVVVAIMLVLYAFGIWDEVRNIKVPKI